MKSNRIYTIGHSNHDLDHFMSLLRQHSIDAVCDVRSIPFSRYTPHFNGAELEKSLAREGIRYLDFSNEFGARRREKSVYDENGYALYSRIAKLPIFEEGIERLDAGLEKGFKIALMCAEMRPETCHRSLLVGRELAARQYDVQHILRNGILLSQAEIPIALRATKKRWKALTDNEVYDYAANVYQYKKK